MKWEKAKKSITSLSDEEKNILELTAALASIRKSKNMTQKEVAEKAHLTQAQIARVQTLSHMPSMETLVKIAKALNLELTFVDKETKQTVNQ